MKTITLNDSFEGKVTLEISDVFENVHHEKTVKVNYTYENGDTDKGLHFSIIRLNETNQWLQDNVGIEGTEEQVNSFIAAIDF